MDNSAPDAVDQATGFSPPFSSSVVHPSAISPPRPGYWLHSLAFVDEHLNGPFPDVVSTSGAHLVTQPNTPVDRYAEPIDPDELHLWLSLALNHHERRTQKYGSDIADGWLFRHTPVEARERYAEAHRKALEELDRFAREDEEEEEEEARRMLQSLPTPENDVDTRCKNMHPQQLPQVSGVLNQVPTATVVRPLSLQSQPNNRRMLTPEEGEDAKDCKKSLNLLPEIAADDVLESDRVLEKAENFTEKRKADGGNKRRRISVTEGCDAEDRIKRRRLPLEVD